MRVFHCMTAEGCDLEVHIDSELKFCKQAASAAPKGTQIIAVMQRSFQDRNLVTLL